VGLVVCIVDGFNEGFIERIRVGSVEGNNKISMVGVTERANVEGLGLEYVIEGSTVSLSDVTFNDEIAVDCADCNVVDSNTPHRHMAINKRMILVVIPFNCCFIT
jgi:predicted DNA-binding helix-hairpin-helix protein